MTSTTLVMVDAEVPVIAPDVLLDNGVAIPLKLPTVKEG